MARSKAFDENEALHHAVKVFADHGYGGTSTEMLLQAMGVSRQSMYDTFGTKRDLFLRSLRTYNAENATWIIDDLQGSLDAIATIKHVLHAFVDRSFNYPGASCLTTQTICEFGVRDEEIHHASGAEHPKLLAMFKDLIACGQSEGTIRDDLDPSTTANFLITTLAGLRISARAGMNRNQLSEMVELSARLLSR